MEEKKTSKHHYLKKGWFLIKINGICDWSHFLLIYSYLYNLKCLIIQQKISYNSLKDMMERGMPHIVEEFHLSSSCTSLWDPKGRRRGRREGLVLFLILGINITILRGRNQMQLLLLCLYFYILMAASVLNASLCVKFKACVIVFSDST